LAHSRPDKIGTARVLKIKVKLHFEKEGFLNLLAEALKKRIKRIKI
jgi:hypothetical protein